MNAPKVSKGRSASNTPQQQPRPPPSNKRHVSGGLKFVPTEQQRAEALERAEKWKNMFAKDDKLKAAIGRIQDFAREDPMRPVDQDDDGGLASPSSIGGEGAEETESEDGDADIVAGQAQVEKKKDVESENLAARRAKHTPALYLLETPRPPPPRPRWDIVSPGPVTPLSPTPSGNAFASGGFWDRRLSCVEKDDSPTPTAVSNLHTSTGTGKDTSIGSTPTTAIPITSEQPPLSEPIDPAAKEIYTSITKQVTNTSLQFCAERLNPHTSSPPLSLIHPSFLRPIDSLHAAQHVFQSSCQQAKAKNITMDADLPAKLAHHAAMQADIVKNYSIHDDAALRDTTSWMHVDELTGEITTVFDRQREELRSERARKDAVVGVGREGERVAWGERVLREWEGRVSMQGEGESSADDDDDEGYEYGNFVRSLRHLGAEGEGEGNEEDEDEDDGEDGMQAKGVMWRVVKTNAAMAMAMATVAQTETEMETDIMHDISKEKKKMEQDPSSTLRCPSLDSTSSAQTVVLRPLIPTPGGNSSSNEGRSLSTTNMTDMNATELQTQEKTISKGSDKDTHTTSPLSGKSAKPSRLPRPSKLPGLAKSKLSIDTSGTCGTETAATTKVGAPRTAEKIAGATKTRETRSGAKPAKTTTTARATKIPSPARIQQTTFVLEKEEQERTRISSTTSTSPHTPLTPLEKEFRHQGPSLTDLTSWAHELRSMQVELGVGGDGNGDGNGDREKRDEEKATHKQNGENEIGIEKGRKTEEESKTERKTQNDIQEKEEEEENEENEKQTKKPNEKPSIPATREDASKTQRYESKTYKESVTNAVKGEVRLSRLLNRLSGLNWSGSISVKKKKKERRGGRGGRGEEGIKKEKEKGEKEGKDGKKK